MDNSNDTARMDWLQAQIDPSLQIDAGGNFLLKIYGKHGKSLREVIDWARQHNSAFQEIPEKVHVPRV